MNKPTWNYILNDLALYSLFTRVAYSEDVPKQDKVDLEHQIKLLQQKVNQLETNRDEAIEYIKNNIQEGYNEVFEAEMRWDAVSGDDLLEILKRGKEC